MSAIAEIMKLRILFTVFFIIAYPLAVHFAILNHRSYLAAILVTSVFIFYLVVAATRQSGSHAFLTALAAILVAGLAFWFKEFLIYWVYIFPVAIYLLLFWVFARTLKPGREPLITGISRLERGGVVPADLLGYTRALTTFWSVFFIFMAISSVLLSFLAPLHVWSYFSNVLSYVLVAAFFLLEYPFRILRFPHHQHSSPFKVMRRIALNGLN